MATLEQQALARIDAAIRAPSGAVTRAYAEIESERIDWLWRGHIARGKLALLAGIAGVGKTTVALGLAATVSCGGRWPDGSFLKEPGNVYIWSGEDGHGDTIKPRLEACGANVNRIYAIEHSVDNDGNIAPFDPARDIPELELAILCNGGGVSLILVDPIVSAVTGDTNKANDVRRSLQPLVDLAAKHNCAMLGITHFTKGSYGSNPAERVLGSQAYAAMARTVLVAAKAEDGASRVLAIAKSNIGVDDGGIAYKIEPYTLDSGIETTRVMWGDKIEGTAREILGTVEPEGRDDDDESAGNPDAIETLRCILSEGALESKEAKKAMLDNGFTAKQTRSAREAIGIVIVQRGNGKNTKTFWSINGGSDLPEIVTNTTGENAKNPDVPSNSDMPSPKVRGISGFEGISEVLQFPIVTNSDAEGEEF